MTVPPLANSFAPHAPASAGNTDGVVKTLTSPGNFPDFYRRMVGLRFPLEVADILELRDSLNQAVDHRLEPTASRDYIHFCSLHRPQIAALGINKDHHAQRLFKLLAMLRELHLAHSIESRDAEAKLRAALARNEKASTQSRGYAKVALGVALIAASLWVALIDPGWFVRIVTVAAGYLSADYFYSLTILQRERNILGGQLRTLLDRRVHALNWPTVVRNLALILGYARISGVQAFVVEGDAVEAGHGQLAHTRGSA